MLTPWPNNTLINLTNTGAIPASNLSLVLTTISAQTIWKEILQSGIRSRLRLTIQSADSALAVSFSPLITTILSLSRCAEAHSFIMRFRSSRSLGMI